MKITNLQDSEIKYSITNTPIPVIITQKGEICFPANDKIQKDLKLNDPTIMAQYKEDIIKCIEYLLLEGFIDKNPLDFDKLSENNEDLDTEE
jgi:hypothetical protein